MVARRAGVGAPHQRARTAMERRPYHQEYIRVEYIRVKLIDMLASVEVKVGAKISSIIGSLEDLMKDRVTIGLGRYKVCDELYENCCRKYEEIVSVAFIKE